MAAPLPAGPLVEEGSLARRGPLEHAWPALLALKNGDQVEAHERFSCAGVSQGLLDFPFVFPSPPS